ncbi:MAG: acetylornithine/succinylornithine family transaminase [archaeon]
MSETANPESHLMGSYRRTIEIVRGAGTKAFDKDGQEYLDLIGGIATCSVGHANPQVKAAIEKQAGILVNASNLFITPLQEELGAKLAELAGLDKVFLSNSGSEAMEAAIKLARKATGKQGFISMEHGFHGRTMGSLSATGTKKYREPFEALVPGFSHVPYGDVAALRKAITPETAGVIIEPIQGEAGIVIPPSGYLKEVATVCEEFGILLIMDEVQTGNGRTGTYFCYQQEGVTPDIVTLAKGMANGLPIAATIARKGLDFSPGEHGSTFGGNSLCCAAALATIKAIEDILPHIQEKHDLFMDHLKAAAGKRVKEIRGKGLMLAIVMEEKGDYAKMAADIGLLINCIDEHIIRLLPPLNISDDEIKEAVSILGEIIGDVA